MKAPDLDSHRLEICLAGYEAVNLVRLDGLVAEDELGRRVLERTYPGGDALEVIVDDQGNFAEEDATIGLLV